MMNLRAVLIGFTSSALVALVGLRSTDDAEFEARLRAAQGFPENQTRLTRGTIGTEHERIPFTMLATSAGRFVMDHGPGLKGDVGFDGERVWGRDYSGRTYDLFGVEYDSELLLNGVIAGNWLGARSLLKFERLRGAPQGEEHVRLFLEGRELDAQIELEADSLRLLRVRYQGGDGESLMEFGDWKTGALGEFAGSLRFSKKGLPIAEVQFDGIELVDDRVADDYRPSLQDRPEFVFDREAAPELKTLVGKTGHTFLRAQLNGRDLGWFAFDTGASHSMISTEVADELELDTIIEVLSGSGSGGTFSFRIGRADSFEVGPVTWKRPVFGITDLRVLGNLFGVKLAGIMGAEMLSQGQWRHDRADSSLAVYPPETDWEDEQVDWIDAIYSAGHFLVSAGFEGHDGMFVVDSGGGGQGVRFDSSAVKEFDLLDGRRTQGVTANGFGGSSRLRGGTVASFAFGTRSWTNLPATFRQPKEAVWEDPYVSGLIGFQMLDPHVVIYDYPGRRLGLLKE